ncbi:MAG: hypothetical protein L0Y58_13000 [Verrucomicrobia subdivision 3 bacterium]|nr:hypothetical protein [Limisphaerales bacterium]
MTSAGPDRQFEMRRIEIDVAERNQCSPTPVLVVHGDPSREATGLWRITNADEVHRPGAFYEWHYGGKTPAITRAPEAAIGYAELLDPNERFKVFHMRLVVRYPDQSRQEGKRSVTVWNRYALAKERGWVQPQIVYDFRASPEGDHLVGRARIINRDNEYITFTSQQIQWLLNTPAVPARPGDPTRAHVTLPPHSEVEIKHQVPINDFPANAFGFAVILRGRTRNGHNAHAAAYFEHHTPHSQGVQILSQPAHLSLLADLRAEACDTLRRRFTRSDLEELGRKSAAKGNNGARNIGALFAVGKSVHALSGSFEGQQCLPDQTPPEEGLACQLTDEWGWVSVPGRFVNARKGDVLLSPGSGGPILGVLRHVSPPQIFSHSAIMIENYYTLRHSTASELWMADHASDSFTDAGSDGLDAESLQYIWPGTINQSAENAMNGELFADPDGKTNEYGDVKQYPLSAMTNGGLDPGNEIVDPLVVKPDPLLEAERDWVRSNLHRVADAAKEIQGHYRFFVYTNAQISSEPTGDFIAPNRSGWWASGTRPTVCSALVWAAAHGLKDPAVRLEGKEVFVKSSDLEPTDVSAGAQVDFRTRDGLYFYTEEERKVAGSWLYDYFYNVAYQIAGAGGVLFTDAASDTANQICNAFAFDWTGWSDVYDDEAKDSDRWKEPGVGRAVSPDNIMLWDPPTSFDGKTVSRPVRLYRTAHLPAALCGVPPHQPLEARAHQGKDRWQCHLPEQPCRRRDRQRGRPFAPQQLLGQIQRRTAGGGVSRAGRKVHQQRLC